MKKALVVLLFVSTGALAEVPNEVAYSGRLREYGQPVNGTRSMNFKIYHTESGPGMDWESGDVSVTVSSGVFTRVIVPTVDWTQGDYWIETVVSGKTLAPREKISSQVFALHASTAEGIRKEAGNIEFRIGSEKKAALDNTGVLSTLVAGTTFYMVPRGAIIMWSGSIDNIPSGWALCNGTSGTPDLTNRFVVGSGDTYSTGSMGGASNHFHTVDSHSHTMGHTHAVSGDTSEIVGSTQRARADGNVGDATGMLNTYHHIHSFDATTGSMSTPNTGSATPNSDSVNGLPPYYALAFLMKI